MYSMEYCDVIVLKIFGFIRPQDDDKIRSALDWVFKKYQKLRIR